MKNSSARKIFLVPVNLKSLSLKFPTFLQIAMASAFATGRRETFLCRVIPTGTTAMESRPILRVNRSRSVRDKTCPSLIPGQTTICVWKRTSLFSRKRNCSIISKARELPSIRPRTETSVACTEIKRGESPNSTICPN